CGIAPSEPVNGLDAFHHRHPEVEQRHIGGMALVGFDRLDSVTRFPDNAQIRLLVDDVCDTASQECMVVYEQHASPAGHAMVAFSLQHGLVWAEKTAPTPARLPYHSAAP